MSQQEFERTDQEVMDLVNGVAPTETAGTAEELSGPSPEELALAEAEKRCQEEKAKEEKRMKAFVRKQKIRDALGIASCVLIAILLLLSMYVPDFLVYVVNLGVLTCGIVVAIIIDRKTRWF